MNDLEIFENKRTEMNDFLMKHTCSFCNKFQSIVVKIPKTDLLICKTCLTKMIKKIDNTMIKNMKKIRKGQK